MSAKKITIHAYKCRCELPDCIGGGKAWTSHGMEKPRSCRWCKRRTWNGEDRRRRPAMTEDERRAYNRKKQTESRARRREKKHATDQSTPLQGRRPKSPVG